MGGLRQRIKEQRTISNHFRKREIVEDIKKVVFCTGISGSDKKAYAHEVAKYAERMGRRIEVFDVEDRMFKIMADLDLHISKNKFLDLVRIARTGFRTAALEGILREIKETCIIVSHFCFLWKDTFDSAFDDVYLEKLKPDFYVTIVHPLHKLKQNILANPASIARRLSDEELLTWQDVEKSKTNDLARSQGKEFYLIPRDQSPKTLYDLIFSQEMKKAYLSYPMAFAKQKHFLKIKKFKENLERHFILFDPGAVEEVPTKDKSLNKKLDNIASKRDYEFIDQSNIVVAYYPEVVPSSGVERECAYAASTGKDVYIVYPARKISSLLATSVTRLFRSDSEFFSFLKKEPGIGSKNPAGRI